MAVVILAAGSIDAFAATNAADTTAVFTLSPRMTCSNCENKIKSNLRFEKGVKEIVTDLKAGTVSVTYSQKKANVESLIKGFKKIGYTATEAVESVEDCSACPGEAQKCGGCSHNAGNCCHSKK